MAVGARVGSRAPSVQPSLGRGRAVEDREHLRLEFLQYLAVFLGPGCSGRSGPLPVAKCLQRLPIVLADLHEVRVASAPPTCFQLAQREPIHDGSDIGRHLCFAPFASHHQRGSLKGRMIALKSARRKVPTCWNLNETSTYFPWARVITPSQADFFQQN